MPQGNRPYLIGNADVVGTADTLAVGFPYLVDLKSVVKKRVRWRRKLTLVFVTGTTAIFIAVS